MRTRKTIQFATCCILCALMGVFAAPTHALANSWTRVYGENAYDTMQACVQADNVFESNRGGTVVVATGDGYWDALAASGLAGTLSAPIVTTPTGFLGDQARAELRRLKPDEVIVMGGTFAVSDNAYAQIRQACPGATVKRVYGDKADDTAIEAFVEGENWNTTCIVATVNGYWDALSIAPFAYSHQAAIFLTNGATGLLSSETANAICNSGFSEVIIVGGTGAVPAGVEKQLAGLKVTRLYGTSAVDTSRVIAMWEVNEQYMSTCNMAIATSGGYWDALAGAPLVGSRNSVLVLANYDELQAIDGVYSQGDGKVHNGIVLGGEMAVPDAIWRYVTGEWGGGPVG